MSIRLVVVWLCLGALPACASAAPSEEIPSELVGVVIDIESRGLNRLESFTVKSGDERWEVLVDSETNFDFAPGHLQEHRATAQPVRVEVEERAGDLYARFVADG